jgi:hypothetical protein
MTLVSGGAIALLARVGGKGGFGGETQQFFSLRGRHEMGTHLGRFLGDGIDRN